MIEKVHLIFKTHLDLGFTDFAERVVERYFKEFFPKAIQTAQTLRQENGSEKFIWTTGSWLIYEFLEQAGPEERRLLENAIAAGDITWHALPFTTHTELMDASLIKFGLSLSKQLDERFGHKTITAKMTDVPGHTRAMIPFLAEAGVRLLHIGVNPASKVPDVPPIFRWVSQEGASIMVIMQGSYGESVILPDFSDALVFVHTEDNMGPQSPLQVREAYSDARDQYPKANITASTMDAFAEALMSVESTIPVVEQEIGDTWIHGVASDPIKINRYRELLRLREEWMKAGKLDPRDKRGNQFSRILLQVPEHTWGLDIKTHLADRLNYSNRRFLTARSQPNFLKMEESWREKRNLIDKAINSLRDPVLVDEAFTRLEGLKPQRPHINDWEKCPPYRQTMEFKHFRIELEPARGCLLDLTDLHTGKSWAFIDRPLGLLGYQTFTLSDYARFWRQYIRKTIKTLIWAPDDYLKPGLETTRTESRWWGPTSWDCFHKDDKVKLLLNFDSPASEKYGCPSLFTMDWDFSQKGSVGLEVQWFDKTPSRLPEAIWLSFIPNLSRRASWSFDKLGQGISPQSVVPNGNRHLHAVGDGGVTFSDNGASLKVISLDAPLIAPGKPSLLDFNNEQPDLRKGIHINLYNNVWGTNYPMWFGEDCRFRFILCMEGGKQG